MSSLLLSAPTIPPICPHFYQCGGCDIQQFAYDIQVKAKEKYLKELFASTDSAAEWLPFLKSPQHYPIYFRNKIRFGFVEQAGKIYPSRHAKGEKKADIPVEVCFLQSELATQLMQFTAEFAERHSWPLVEPGSSKGWLKHLLIRQARSTGETLVSLVTNSGVFKENQEWIEEITSRFPQVVSLYHSQTQGRNNMDIKDKLLWGKERIVEIIGDYQFGISPHAFFQTNGEMVETLYTTIRNTVLPFLPGTLWDLYAGSASIGIFLQELASEVIAIESNSQNIQDAYWNIEANQLNNITVINQTVEKALTGAFLRTHSTPAVIVVDPPRAGLAGSLKTILPQLPSHELVYVSCNPATCQRDTQELINSGYQLISLRGLDMFPHTEHCEMIVHLHR